VRAVTKGEDREVQLLPAIEQDELDRSADVAECLQRVADQNRHTVTDAHCFKVDARGSGFLFAATSRRDADPIRLRLTRPRD
jgi:hypothetical protein